MPWHLTSHIDYSVYPAFNIATPRTGGNTEFHVDEVVSDMSTVKSACSSNLSPPWLVESGRDHTVVTANSERTGGTGSLISQGSSGDEPAVEMLNIATPPLCEFTSGIVASSEQRDVKIKEPGKIDKGVIDAQNPDLMLPV